MLGQGAAFAGDAFGAAVCSSGQEGCDLWAGTSGHPEKPSVLSGARPSTSSEAESVTCPTVGTGALPCLDTMRGWSGSDGCRYQAATDFVPSAAVEAERATPGEKGSWYWRSCGGASFEAVWLPDAVTAGAVLSPATLAQVAVKKLRLPAPSVMMSPGVGVPQLVGVPVWLWLGGVWGPVSVTATVPGVSVTATARPQEVVWDFGAGGAVSCRGPGTPFRVGVDDPAAGSPDCGVVFVRSSAGQSDGRFPVTVTVRWQVGWVGAG
ncbi:hypothetical protein, partial [Frankia torreyi]